MNRRPQPHKGGGGGGGSNSHRPRRKRRGEGSQRPDPVVEQVSRAAPVLKTYKVVFYENLAQAREDALNLAELKASCGQLNIVVRTEGGMDDPLLLQYGKVFAGEAWTLIHKRRVDDGWYNEPHE